MLFHWSRSRGFMMKGEVVQVSKPWNCALAAHLFPRRLPGHGGGGGSVHLHCGTSSTQLRRLLHGGAQRGHHRGVRQGGRGLQRRRLHYRKSMQENSQQRQQRQRRSQVCFIFLQQNAASSVWFMCTSWNVLLFFFILTVLVTREYKSPCT